MSMLVSDVTERLMYRHRSGRIRAQTLPGEESRARGVAHAGSLAAPSLRSRNVDSFVALRTCSVRLREHPRKLRGYVLSWRRHANDENALRTQGADRTGSP
jgi:hypothetical protein